MTFKNNSSAKAGGVIYSGGTLNITDVTFTGNAAAGNGGAVFASGGTAALTNVTSSGNTANRGYDVYGYNDAAIIIDDSSLTSGGDATGTAAVYTNASNTITLRGKVTAVINAQKTAPIEVESDFSAQSDINVWLDGYSNGRVVLTGDAAAIRAAVEAGAVTSTRAVEKGFTIGTDGKLTK